MHFYFEETWGVAAKYFRRLLRREENDLIRFFAGECEERLGHFAVARREYERVARSDRDSVARRSAMKALARLGR